MTEITLENREELERKKAAEQALQQELKQQVLASCLIKENKDIPSPKCGLEGMKEADRILKEKGLIGVLIGGLGLDLYTDELPDSDDEPSVKALAKLDSHKDVDVFVIPVHKKKTDSISDASQYFKKFEGGIDWWFVKERKAGKYTIYNGNGCECFFQVSWGPTVWATPGLKKTDPSKYETVQKQISQQIAEKRENLKKKRNGTLAGLYILPWDTYSLMFMDQKEAEISKLYSDPDILSTCEEMLSDVCSLKETMPLIPEIGKQFWSVEDLNIIFDLSFNNAIFSKVWNEQQGTQSTLEQENERGETPDKSQQSTQKEELMRREFLRCCSIRKL